MHLGKTRYVAACQQLLTLGVVVAALVPAAGVVTLDVVREAPAGSTTAVAPTPTGALAAYTKAALTPSVVAAAPTDASVKEVQLTAPVVSAIAGRRAVGGVTTRRITANARQAVEAKSTVITSTPQPVTGFGTVGVTWEHGDELQPSQIRVDLRTCTAGSWSGWKKLDYDIDGPDTSSIEGKRSRPGTMEALVGHVDQVQVRMTITGASVPADMKLAVIAPGQAPTTMARAAIDTAALDTAADQAGAVDAADPAGQAVTGQPGDEQATLSAASIVTPEPQIYSRAQWGADEKVREQSAPSYAEVHGGFVHHTVNANDYTAAEVPGILRSIYAYHVKSRGWRDIGYNFLVDRFGRLWEGRYGGVDRPVVGAHTENYNDYGFGISAIGNFETAKPTEAMIQAEGALFAWKLSLHGVSAAATNVKIGSRVFASSIMGHRDTKATACPGKYLYARIPDIRTIAASLQQGWSGRTLQSSFVGSADPDLVVRNAATKEVYIVPTGGGDVPAPPVIPAPPASSDGSQTVVAADLTGDGKPDLVKVSKAGRMKVKAGDGLGHYPSVVRRDRTGFVARNLITSIGDVNGDHRNDLAARIASGKHTGRLALYLGNGDGTFKAVVRGLVRLGQAVQIIAGDRSGDGRPDLLVRKPSGMTLYRGTGTGRFAAGTPYTAPAGRTTTGVGAPVDTGLNLPNAIQLMNAGDWDRDGNADLISRNTDGSLWLYLGNGQGRFAAGTLLASGFGAVSLLSVGGDITGDGFPDLQGQINGAMRIYPGRGAAGLGSSYVSHSAIPGSRQVAAGLWTGDGAPDAIFLTPTSTVLYPGNGPGGLTNPVTIGGALTGYSWVVGVSDAGRSALIVRDAAGSLFRIDPTSTGMLGAPQLLGSGYSGYDLAG